MCEKRDCHYRPLREKCPNTEFLLVRIFPNSNWIRRETSYAGKYGPEKSPYLDTFHVVGVWISKADNSYGVLLFYKIKRPGNSKSEYFVLWKATYINLKVRTAEHFSCILRYWWLDSYFLFILTWKYALMNIFPVIRNTDGLISKWTLKICKASMDVENVKMNMNDIIISILAIY